MLPSDIIKVRHSLINYNVENDIIIASISDIHISSCFSYEKLKQIIRAMYILKPNYICILGDFIDSPSVIDKEYKKCFFLLNELSKICPIYMVLGNHDYINYQEENKYKEEYNEDFFNKINLINNVKLLNDEVIYLDDITIMGYTEKYNVYHNRNLNSFYNDLSTKENLYKIKGNNPKVALIHSPEPLKYKNNIDLLKDYNLILSGHYHGGCIPFFLESIWPVKTGGIVTPTKELFPNDVRGIKKITDKTYLIYNEGYVKISESTRINYFDKYFYRNIDLTTISSSVEEIEIFTKKLYKK